MVYVFLGFWRVWRTLQKPSRFEGIDLRGVWRVWRVWRVFRYEARVRGRGHARAQENIDKPSKPSIFDIKTYNLTNKNK